MEESKGYAMKEKIKDYLTETIQTKKNMKKRILQLDDDLKEIKANNKDLIKERDMYKTKLRTLKQEYTEYQKEMELILNKYEKELKRSK
jgi:hypothetical protein